MADDVIYDDEDDDPASPPHATAGGPPPGATDSTRREGGSRRTSTDDDLLSELGPSAGQQSRPVPGTTGTAPSQAAADVTEAVQERVVLAGASGVGKTLWLCSLKQACHVNRTTGPRLGLVYGKSLAELIVRGHEVDRGRESLPATAGLENYQFNVTLRSGGSANGDVLNLADFVCFDGPGGALFLDDLTKRTMLSDVIADYRRALIAAGRNAASLVFLVSPIDRFEQSHISGNLTLLLPEMCVPTQITLAPPAARKAFVPWRRLLGRRDATPPPRPRVVTVPRLPARRVVFVFNHVDQVAVRWQEEWARDNDPRAKLSPLEIARQYVKPIDIARSVLGPELLQDMRSFMRDDARLAVGVCSAGGFTSNGAPFRGPDGRVNVMVDVDPQAAEEHRVVFGVREILMFAGFGITTPGVVEEVPLDLLSVAEES